PTFGTLYSRAAPRFFGVLFWSSAPPPFERVYPRGGGCGRCRGGGGGAGGGGSGGCREDGTYGGGIIAPPSVALHLLPHGRSHGNGDVDAAAAPSLPLHDGGGALELQPEPQEPHPQHNVSVVAGGINVLSDSGSTSSSSSSCGSSRSGSPYFGRTFLPQTFRSVSPKRASRAPSTEVGEEKSGVAAPEPEPAAEAGVAVVAAGEGVRRG
ncbi:unnamed protein product, partial [Pylaiella littoralis]